MTDVKKLADALDFSDEKRELLALLLEEEGIELRDRQAIVPRERSVNLPLSFAQQRLWVLDQLEPGSPVYNDPVALLLSGPLDPSALERSLNELVRRHETLRTTFSSVDGQPVQVIAPALTVSLPLVDLREIPQAEREEAASGIAAEEVKKPFDLEHGPVWRVRLLRLAEEDHILLLVIHHIAIDGWSWAVLIRELGAVYEAFAKGEPSPLPELPIQYGDFAVWQREWLEGQVLESQLSYWKRQLDGVSEVLELPTDRPRPAVQTYRGARHTVLLPRKLTDSLKALSQREGGTLFMTLLAAFQSLLSRYTGREDIAVGTLIANRNREEIDGLIGFFVNTLVMRSELAGDPTFRELLGQVREMALEAYAHQDLPFEKLVEELSPERSLSHNPLFQIMFRLHGAPMPTLRVNGLTLSPIEVDVDTSKFDLTLDLVETPKGLSGFFEYSTDLFDRVTISRMLGHFQTMLEGIVADPDQRISTLPLLTEAEQRKLLVEWNDTASDYPKEGCIHELIAEQARRTPEAIAVLFEDTQLSYAELNAKANQLARYLRKQGVGPEVLVGICVERSVEMMVALLGVLKAGGAYVPLDWKYPQRRLAMMIEDAGVAVVVSEEKVEDLLPEHSARKVLIDSGWEEIGRESDEDPESGVSSENLAYVIYTSGSTGKPKGVQVPHRAVINFLSSMQEQPGISNRDRLLAVTTLSFDIAGLELLLPLTVGAQVVLVSRDVASDGARLLQKLADSDATVMQATPATWRLLLSSGWQGSKQLRILCGGEALSRELADELLEKCGSLWNLYGPSETTIWSALCRVTPGASPVPIGGPIANTEIYVLDCKQQPVPIGVWGEIYIGGAGLARGYLGRPELTAEGFVPNPFSLEPGARLYKTGDVARYLSNGNIEFLGRSDHQVKVRGYRIELGEIESVLAQHPGVRETVAVVREAVPGDQRLVAYVVGNRRWAGEPALAEWKTEQVSQWRLIWDGAYGQPSQPDDPTFNLAGWNSSYTGQPIPQEQMREWVEGTVERVLSLEPTRVLEIGCGAGLLLFRIAPNCREYWGTDFSERALKYVEERVIEQSLQQVRLLHREAEDFEGIPAGSFDAVIINSVVQYFPDSEYLARVLERAVKTVAPGGFVFVGDVRSLPLLEAFHTSVELHKAADSVTREELLERVRRRSQQEEELVLDPEFFRDFKEQVPEIDDVEVLLKRGRHHNELTEYRYDVILRVGKTEENGTEDGIEWIEWSQARPSAAAIRELVRSSNAQALAVSGVANARVAVPVKAAEVLKRVDGLETVGDLREALRREGNAGLDPEELWGIGEETGRRVDLIWNGRGGDGSYEVLISRGEKGKTRRIRATEKGERKTRLGPHEYANDPMRARATGELVRELRGHLKERLPEYMIPAAIVVMDSLPLTANGKVDRRRLPGPERLSAGVQASYEAPRNEIEEVVAGIWREALGIEQVGIRDSFFELGGHSLLATQLIFRLQDAFKVEIGLRALFEEPTVAGLSGVIAQLKGKAAHYVPLPAVVSDPEHLHEPFPLTDVQQAYWIGRSGSFELGDVSCHAYTEIEATGLDLDRLELALQRLIDRHEMMRAVVLPDGQQRILEQVPRYRIEVLDLRGQEPQIQAAQLEILRRRMSHQVLPSDQWPLFEFRASRVDEERTRLHISFDLLIADARSFHILFGELAQLYRSPDVQFAPLELSFRDYQVAVAGMQDSDTCRRSQEYWMNRLPELPPAPELPLVKSPGSVTHAQFVRRSARLEPETWARLKARAARSGVTPSGVLLAAFAEVLSVWSKSPRFTLNLTLFNRLPLHAQVNEIVGDFTSVTLLEVDNSTEETFETRARRIQEQLWEDMDHRYFSGIRVLRELARSQGGTPRATMPVVFTSILNMGTVKHDASALKTLGEIGYCITQTPQVYLDVQVLEDAGALSYNWDTLEELFPAGLLDDVFDANCRLLRRLADEADCWREVRLRTVPAAQLEQRAAVNATQTAIPEELLHTRFATQAAQRPDQPAVIAPRRNLSYGELYGLSNRVARWLRQHGAQPNTLVAVVMEKGWEQVAAVLGVLQSGAAYLPIDSEVPQERLSYLINHGEARLILTQSWLDEKLGWPEDVRRLCVDEDLAGLDDAPLEFTQKPEDLAYVIYTSGSTGLPKGVMIDHRGAVNTIADMNLRFGVGPEDRVLALSSLSFDLSVYDIFGTLASGGTIVIPEASARRDPAHWAELVAREGVTIWNSVPALMEMMVDYVAESAEPMVDSLRTVLLSGDWVPVGLPGRIKALAPNSKVISLGGATEASIWSILYPVEEVNGAWKSIPYGRPMANQSFHVLNHALDPCPVWVPGELYIGGAGLARGYWRDEEKTRASFIRHPRTGERLYRTGDLGRYLSDGNIEFLGREDFQVKVQGYRIELGEIESTLAQHPAVRNVVVTAVGEPRGGKRLVAYVVSDEERGGELRGFLKEKLPEYMVPSVFVFLDALPLTPNGKVNLSALPAADLERPESEGGFVAPETPVEEALAGIWTTVLGLEQVSTQDDFFELGGDSLMGTKAVFMIRKAFQIHLPVRSLFETPTIAGLALVIEEMLIEEIEKLPEEEASKFNHSAGSSGAN